MGGKVLSLQPKIARNNATNNIFTDTVNLFGRVISHEPYNNCIYCGARVQNVPLDDVLPRLAAKGPIYGHVTCRCQIEARKKRLERIRERRPY